MPKCLLGQKQLVDMFCVVSQLHSGGWRWRLSSSSLVMYLQPEPLARAHLPMLHPCRQVVYRAATATEAHCPTHWESSLSP